MKPRHRRLTLIALVLGGLGLSAGLALTAFQDNLVFFFTPSEVMAREAPIDRPIRIGGLVKAGSVEREAASARVHFKVTDTAESITVSYDGILPDLFREGQGVVAQGRLGADGRFHATQVLARHDETYMPAEAKEALDRIGQGNGTPGPDGHPETTTAY
ncbi:cytochrome c maturation protein CcmE [Alkalilimnicola ehrlichii MLHE-1]|uniref:Cytochrome c-type biogenesis protein CcmE n=1 Tax=Alkalilimnicola ehrlichii (strain ATCC BAA-1101 / DSM 17681 / MLHE-1) TaxID=187272 RepID=CCME_ALKEH|nr:cytochrome c maturation protein CcmE [Alkalilimnicola ehrlichii]Q0A805.1 RecName: Full=Cytochrome c-type biogenesis protein CcmE; AltName: Full=Cytochrome c maturation protein E; AltName: Full=Heme chaperone CcmE [Alkalilimnicola ehrlichii MLHE-1]ABI57032.1 CcmE/CycJ protein [Alkalilimnicola ehrlichii MLHE-1]